MTEATETPKAADVGQSALEGVVSRTAEPAFVQAVRINAKFLRDCHDDLSEAEANVVATKLEQCAALIEKLERAMALTYGYLWHVNNEPGTPYPPEKAAYAARKILRDLMTSDQRGMAINEVRELMLAANKD